MKVDVEIEWDHNIIFHMLHTGMINIYFILFLYFICLLLLFDLPNLSYSLL